MRLFVSRRMHFQDMPTSAASQADRRVVLSKRGYGGFIAICDIASQDALDHEMLAIAWYASGKQLPHHEPQWSRRFAGYWKLEYAIYECDVSKHALFSREDNTAALNYDIAEVAPSRTMMRSLSGRVLP